MEDVLFPLCAAAAWSAFAYKTVHVIRDPTPERALVCLLIAFPATSFTLAWPLVHHRFDRMVGIPNLATLVVYDGIVLFSATSQVWLLLLTYPRQQVWRRAWPRLAVFAASLVAMMVLFRLAPIDTEATDFDRTYARARYVPAFLVVYIGSFAVGLLGVAHLCWRWARQTDRAWLRRGLVMMTLGSGFGLGYCLAKVTYLSLRTLGLVQEIWNELGPISASVGAVLILVGFTLPAAGSVADWAGRWVMYQRIYPLWRELTGRLDGVRLPVAEGPRLRWLTARNLDFLLYRRVIECLDARLLLREWMDPRVTELARRACAEAGITGVEADAIVEAAQLRAALRTRAMACRARRGRSEAHPPTPPGGPDLVSEMTWLARVAAARKSPIAAAAGTP